MSDQPPQEPTHQWSLDDVDDDALMARLKKLPGFADLFVPPTPASTPARGGDDSVTQKILSALERLGDKSSSAPAQVPGPPPTPQVVERVIEKAHSWFFDD